MKHSVQETWPINQLLIFWSLVLIILAILKYSSGLVVPFLIAIALAIVLTPLFNFLERKRIPKVISLLFIILIVLIPTVILGGYLGEEVKEFIGNFENTKVNLSDTLEKISQFTGKFGINITQAELHAIFEKSNVTAIIKNLASQASSQFSNIFLIVFTLAFMLVETDAIYNKVIKITKDQGRDIDDLMKIVEKVKSYFLIKVKTSLVTAIWVFAVLWFYDVNYAYLWATLAFFLNFIPVVGSILAAVPPVVMALIDQTAMVALWVGVWFIIINMVIGNILEPRIMGKGLGISALVIFISMTFWGYIFGPAGMILSAPLTLVIQFIFSQYKETQWIALLLSDYEGEKEGELEMLKEEVKELKKQYNNNKEGEIDGKNDNA